jgi:hypothetical protein
MAFKDTQLFIATLADCQLISVVWLIKQQEIAFKDDVDEVTLPSMTTRSFMAV